MTFAVNKPKHLLYIHHPSIIFFENLNHHFHLVSIESGLNFNARQFLKWPCWDLSLYLNCSTFLHSLFSSSHNLTGHWTQWPCYNMYNTYSKLEIGLNRSCIKHVNSCNFWRKHLEHYFFSICIFGRVQIWIPWRTFSGVVFWNKIYIYAY